MYWQQVSVAVLAFVDCTTAPSVLAQYKTTVVDFFRDLRS